MEYIPTLTPPTIPMYVNMTYMERLGYVACLFGHALATLHGSIGATGSLHEPGRFPETWGPCFFQRNREKPPKVKRVGGKGKGTPKLGCPTIIGRHPAPRRHKRRRSSPGTKAFKKTRVVFWESTVGDLKMIRVQCPDTFAGAKDCRTGLSKVMGLNFQKLCPWVLIDFYPIFRISPENPVE